MPKFRKKPVVVSAVQLTAEGIDLARREHAEHSWFLNATHLPFQHDACGFVPPGQVWLMPDYSAKVGTPQGTMLAGPGDWIVRDVDGKLYPCHQEIFVQTYERVEENEGGE